MKRLAIITGIISIILVSLGSVAKVMHWPGAGITLTLGIFILAFIFTPTSLRNSFKNNGSKSAFFYVAIGLTAALLFVSALFKVLHWPGAGILLIIGSIFPFIVLIPVLLIYSRKGQLLSISNLIVVLLFLAYLGVTATFLALNISKDMIDEAVQIEKEMHSLEQLAERVNNTTKNNYKTEAFMQASAEMSAEIDNLKKQLLQFNQPDKSPIKSTNTEAITYKDNYSIAAHVFSHQNSQLINTAVKFSKYKKAFQEFHSPNEKASINENAMQNALIQEIGSNPKIWAYTNLTAIESQRAVQTHLYLKSKILNEPPE
ncbi:MAG: hypothetical protein C0599_14255 [Salinivirgaceae bacterium]|nr:MAG: hypothetical protein C0599_14255 [Salinivirgaceae bacterium]